MEAIEVIPRISNSVFDAYATSIPNRLVVERIGCAPDDVETIQAERESFRDFQYRVGIEFLSNIDAWETYNFDLEIAELMGEVDNFAPDDYAETSWMHDVESIIARAIRPENYNEYGGQQ